MTVGEIVDLIKWAEEASDSTLRARRQERVKEKLYPKNLSEPHRKRREALEQKARAILRERIDEQDPMPNMLQDVLPFEWRGAFTAESETELREELAHDGTWDEVEEMLRRANGSPFDALPREEKSQTTARPRLKRSLRNT